MEDLSRCLQSESEQEFEVLMTSLGQVQATMAEADTYDVTKESPETT